MTKQLYGKSRKAVGTLKLSHLIGRGFKETDNELLTGSALEVIIITEPFATETFQKEVIFCQFILSINCTNAF